MGLEPATCCLQNGGRYVHSRPFPCIHGKTFNLSVHESQPSPLLSSRLATLLATFLIIASDSYHLLNGDGTAIPAQRPSVSG